MGVGGVWGGGSFGFQIFFINNTLRRSGDFLKFEFWDW